MNHLYVVQEKQIWQDGAAFNDRSEYQVWYGEQLLAAYAMEETAIEKAKRLHDRLIAASNFFWAAQNLYATWSFKNGMPCLHLQDLRLTFYFGAENVIEKVEGHREYNPE